ncbi:hypothetical protein BU24DRAFT_418161 [Aaosphaeria arxii CBS 175.79]|uniref:N-acetyltransferase domain-containing protein n=1 Tax=Aaosphaeria arxii CBS 175.79 TaxID=1450172 RepID=A0A6A5Y145_9PLEO|nr:uncharacterized protein BU24DRAFT_418161 [Aaosphaeria arxii CBS 175.79]KAF2018641.1 hypothetical protein BU24DRAFT_418161 [Aaosphaeria arxii CBS 175.79]
MPLIVAPLTTSDTTSWTRIRTLAYAGPTHNIVHSRPVSEETIRRVSLDRQAEIGKPNAWHFKVVDTELSPAEDDPPENGGQTIAFAVWSAHNIDLTPDGYIQNKTTAHSTEESTDEPTINPAETATLPTEAPSKDAEQKLPYLPPELRLEVLSALLNPLRDACTEIMGSKPYLMLNSLATHPEHQQRGAGRLLLKWGLDVADRAGLELYLDTSLRGRKLYEKEGFRLVKGVEFDRTPWGGEGVDWHGCMVRSPRGKVSE